MIIGVNGFAMVGQRSGIHLYAQDLLRALLAIDQTNSYVVWLPHGSGAEDGPAAPNLTRIVLSQSVRDPLQQVLWETVLLPVALRRQRVDLLFSPSHTLPPLMPRETIGAVTIHDLGFLHAPRTKTWRFRVFMRRMVRHAIDSANLVLVNSEHTRREVLAFGGRADHVVTTHLAAGAAATLPPSPSIVERVRARWGLGDTVVLAVGNIEPRKNLERLVEGVADVRDRLRRRVQLVLAGKSRRGLDRLRHAIRDHGLEADVIFTGYVPDEELSALYRYAAVCVYPSLYEGFGMPPLEAMLCGTPVVASKASAIPEVVGDAALLFDPYSAKGIADAIVAVLTDASVARELVARGAARGRRFSWEQTARATLDAFTHALSRSGERSAGFLVTGPDPGWPAAWPATGTG